MSRICAKYVYFFKTLQKTKKQQYYSNLEQHQKTMKRYSTKTTFPMLFWSNSVKPAK